MTVDWLVLLTPLLLVPIVLLFVFVGCGLDSAGSSEIAVEVDADIRVEYTDSVANLAKSASAAIILKDSKDHVAVMGQGSESPLDPDGGGFNIALTPVPGEKFPRQGKLICTGTVTLKTTPPGKSAEIKVGLFDVSLAGIPYPNLMLSHTQPFGQGEPQFHLTVKTKTTN